MKPILENNLQTFGLLTFDGNRNGMTSKATAILVDNNKEYTVDIKICLYTKRALRFLYSFGCYNSTTNRSLRMHITPVLHALSNSFRKPTDLRDRYSVSIIS